MGLGRHALGQRQFHGGQHGLFVVLHDKREEFRAFTGAVTRLAGGGA